MIKGEMLSSIFNKVSDRHSLIKNIAEKKFMTDHTFMEVHCIELIESINDANVTKLSKAFKMTRGAISKIAKKLLEKGSIEIYKNPENKKEIYYKLTEIGKYINLQHEKMHRERIERDSIIFNQLSENEKDTLNKLLNKVYDQLANELKKLEMDDYI